MFCYNCGKQIDDDSTFCPYCGTKVKEVEAVKETPKVQEPIKQDINNTQPITNPTPKKPIPIPLIAAAGAIGLIILITVGYFLINMGSINALDGAEMTFEGYNNYGTFDVTFNTENNKSYEKLQEKLYTYQEELLDTCFIDKSSKKCQDLAEKSYYLEKALSSTNYSYSVSGDKPTDELSNGDTVTMTIE